MSKAATPRRNAKPRPERKRANPGERDQVRLEQEIERAETELRVIEDELADPGAWSSPEKSAQHTARHEQAKRALDELYRRWEETAV